MNASAGLSLVCLLVLEELSNFLASFREANHYRVYVKFTNDNLKRPVLCTRERVENTKQGIYRKGHSVKCRGVSKLRGSPTQICRRQGAEKNGSEGWRLDER